MLLLSSRWRESFFRSLRGMDDAAAPMPVVWGYNR